MNKATKVLIGAAIAVLATGSAHAALVVGDLVNVDFNAGGGPTATGAAAISSPTNSVTPDFWNGESGSSGTNASLLTAAGGSTGGVTLTWSATGSFDNGTSPNNNASLMRDYLYDTVPSNSTMAAPVGAGSANLSGLPAGTYNLYLYSQSAPGFNLRFAGFSVNGSAPIYVGNDTSSATFDQADTVGNPTSTGNYVAYMGVSPDGGGNLNTAFWVGNDSDGDFNGLQLQVATLSAPEPGSLGLLALAGGFLLRRRAARARA